MNNNKIDIHFIDRNIDEFYELLSVFSKVFEWEEEKYPSKDYLVKLLENTSFLAIVAKSGIEVIGGLTAYILDSYQEQVSSIYIYDLGVKEEFQNRGVGKSLINFLVEYSKSNNIQDIFVDTEQIDNEDVIAFYRKTSFDSEIKVLQYTYKLIGNENNKML